MTSDKINYFSSNSLFQIITRILHSSKDSDWCWLAAAVKINPRTLSDWSFRLDKPRENNKKRIRIYDREKLTIAKACELCFGIFIVKIISLNVSFLWHFFGLDCSKMSAWRAAGLSYVRYSFVASNALKKAMTTEAQGKTHILCMILNFLPFFSHKDQAFRAILKFFQKILETKCLVIFCEHK